MPQRNLGHQRLLYRSAKDGPDSGIASHLVADMVHDGHDTILIPPFRILNALNLTAHNDNLTSGNKLSTTISGAEMRRNTRDGNRAVKRLGETLNHLVPLSRGKLRRGLVGENKVAIQINDEGIGGGGKE